MKKMRLIVLIVTPVAFQGRGSDYFVPVETNTRARWRLRRVGHGSKSTTRHLSFFGCCH